MQQFTLSLFLFITANGVELESDLDYHTQMNQVQFELMKNLQDKAGIKMNYG